MPLVRCIMEMGMGVDVHGLDYTSAAKRAVFDALHHSSLGFQQLLGKTADDMEVQVTIGVPKPEAVDGQAVLETPSLPANGSGQPDRPLAGRSRRRRRRCQAPYCPFFPFAIGCPSISI